MPIMPVMNWTSLIADLRARGWTQAALADRLGCKQPTISDLANGKITNPSYELGARLVEIHATPPAPPIDAVAKVGG